MVTLNMLNEAATSRKERRYVAHILNAEEYLTRDLSDLRAKRKSLYQKLYSAHSQNMVRSFFFDMARREYTEACLRIDDKIQEAKEAKNG